MDAVSNNDVEKIRELQLRYSSNFTNGPGTKAVRHFNLNGGRFDVETEMEEVINPEGLNEEVIISKILQLFIHFQVEPSKIGIDTDKHTVQSFVDTYISEDSKSFQDLMEYEDKKRRAQFDWIYKAEEKHNKELVERGKPMIMEADKQLMKRKEPGKYFVSFNLFHPSLDDDRPTNIDNWEYKAKNNVLFGPEGAAPTLREFMEAVRNDNSKIINREATRIDTSKINWKEVSFCWNLLVYIFFNF
jgi:protein DGCR14